MVLHPLEFSECFLDSPWFQQSIKEHEDELENTNSQIKQLIKDAKAMLLACKKQYEMTHFFIERLKNFEFEIIGENLTDAERGIAGSLKEFGTMLEEVGEEWSKTIQRSELQLIQPLENFRKDHIHSYRDAKKLFDKSRDRYYKQMDHTLALSHKKKEQQLQDSDKELVTQKKNFHRASLQYVYKLQEVQERKKFEFVEHLLMFMQVYFNFFHQTHETANDCKEYMTDIQSRLVNTRSQYEGTREKTQMLMRKMMEDPSTSTTKRSENHSPQRVVGQRWARAGYLFLLEKNPLSSRFSAKWSRYFCMYTKENKLFQMLPPFTHASSSGSNTTSKIASINLHGNGSAAVDPLIVLSCTRRQTDSIDKRFCFDIDVEDSAGKQSTFTLQATSLSDRKKWIAAMDGKEPNYVLTHEYRKPEAFTLNETSIKFVKDVIAEIERRGVDAEGIYRLVGVSSKVDKILQLAMDPKMHGALNYQDDEEWELNTLTSALKNFFRNLPEPIMTFGFHEDFIAAAKREDPNERLNRVISLVKKLSPDSQLILELLIRHLVRVSSMWQSNKMTAQNIGVCFGPTLMRPKQETVQSIMEIKFNNIIVEILIEDCDAIFGTREGEEKKPTSPKPLSSKPSSRFSSRQKTLRHTSIREADAEKSRPQHTQETANSRFQRGHAIRGLSSISPSHRARNRTVKIKPAAAEKDDDTFSSGNNTDEFGRISPLDMNLDLGHFSLNPSSAMATTTAATYTNLLPKTQPILPPLEDRVEMEDWEPKHPNNSLHRARSERAQALRRNARSSQSERARSPPNLNENRNNSARSSSPEPGSPPLSVRERKEKFMHKASSVKQPPLVVPRRKPALPLQDKPLQNHHVHSSGSRQQRPAGIVNFKKLKENFSRDNAKAVGSTAQSKPDLAGDHSTTVLRPKPGDIRPNVHVETNCSTEAKSVDSPVVFPASAGVIYQALYACRAEHDSELSFSPGDVIRDVRPSEEPGWLVGTLNDRTGLIPENYVRKNI